MQGYGFFYITKNGIYDLLKRNEDTYLPPDVEIQYIANNNTELITSIIHDRQDIVTQLLNRKEIDVNIPNDLGNTALITAIIYNQENIVTQLLNRYDINLHLQNNEITKIPSELGELYNLSVLHLYNNQNVVIPSELGNLYNLEILSLQSNKIT